MSKPFLINDSITSAKHVPIKTFDIKCKPKFRKDPIKSMTSEQLDSRKMQRGIISAATSRHQHVILKLSQDGGPLFRKNHSQSFSPVKRDKMLPHQSTCIHSSRMQTTSKSTYSDFYQTGCGANNYKKFPARKTFKNNNPYKMYMFAQDQYNNQ